MLSTFVMDKDGHGCRRFIVDRIFQLLLFVYCPALLMRIIGLALCMSKRMIIMQIYLIYGYLFIAVSFWDWQTLKKMTNLDYQCKKPISFEMVSLHIMITCFIVILVPYMLALCVVPAHAMVTARHASIQHRESTMKQSLINEMPSVVLTPKMFKAKQIECAICMERFKEHKDYITPLYCDNRHYFHSDCI